MEWYYADSGQRVGPITETDLQSLYVSGKVKLDTLVWKAGMPEWQPFSATSPAFGPQTANGQFCTECGRQYGSSDLLAFGAARVCSDCKDVFFQRVREQGSAVAAQSAFLLYAGFWIRAVARLIDGLILGVFFVILMVLAGVFFRRSLFAGLTNPNAPISPSAIGAIYAAFGLIYLISIGVSVLYESWFVANRGGTPGKLVLGLRIVRANGAALTPGRSIGRAFAYILDSVVPFAIGFIIAGFDDQKRALHDHICDTRVIRKLAA
jgi:uncharacterized RDD family membrane protein YckC